MEPGTGFLNISDIGYCNRIGDAELLAGIDRRADEYGLTRAETMRRALADAFPIIPKD